MINFFVKCYLYVTLQKSFSKKHNPQQHSEICKYTHAEKTILDFSPESSFQKCNQRHSDRRPSTPACPACWAMGINKVKKCSVRKIIFYTGLIRAAKAGQNLLYRHDKSNEPTKEGPYHLSSLRPHSPQFQQSAGATPLKYL
jgi:hypothetical protein